MLPLCLFSVLTVQITCTCNCEPQNLFKSSFFRPMSPKKSENLMLKVTLNFQTKVGGWESNRKVSPRKTGSKTFLGTRGIDQSLKIAILSDTILNFDATARKKSMPFARRQKSQIFSTSQIQSEKNI